MKIKNNKGFSLIELLVALAIASMIIVVATRFLSTVLKQYNKNNYDIKLQTEVEEILNLIENWIMDAYSAEVSSNGSNDILTVEKKLDGVNSIASDIYVSGDSIYYNKKYTDGNTSKVYLGTHISEETDKKNLSFTIPDNQRAVIVSIRMKYGSSSYDASRKILLRNWEEGGTIEDDDDNIPDDDAADVTPTKETEPEKKEDDSKKDLQSAEFTSDANIKDNNHNLKIGFSLKNTGPLARVGNDSDGKNGLVFVVYYFVENKKGDTLENLLNPSMWQSNQGIITSVSQKSKFSSGKSDFYCCAVTITSTIDLSGDWNTGASISTDLACQINSNLKIYGDGNNANFMGINGAGQPYLEAYYNGKLIATHGTMPDFLNEVKFEVTQSSVTDISNNGTKYKVNFTVKKTGEMNDWSDVQFVYYWLDNRDTSKELLVSDYSAILQGSNVELGSSSVITRPASYSDKRAGSNGYVTLYNNSNSNTAYIDEINVSFVIESKANGESIADNISSSWSAKAKENILIYCKNERVFGDKSTEPYVDNYTSEDRVTISNVEVEEKWGQHYTKDYTYDREIDYVVIVWENKKNSYAQIQIQGGADVNSTWYRGQIYSSSKGQKTDTFKFTSNGIKNVKLALVNYDQVSVKSITVFFK